MKLDPISFLVAPFSVERVMILLLAAAMIQLCVPCTQRMRKLHKYAAVLIEFWTFKWIYILQIQMRNTAEVRDFTISYIVVCDMQMHV